MQAGAVIAVGAAGTLIAVFPPRTSTI